MIGKQAVVAGVGIRLEKAVVAIEEINRALAGAVLGVVIDDMGMLEVANIDPDTSLACVFTGPIEHRQDGVVAVDDIRLKDVAPEFIINRFEQVGASPDPAAESLAGELHAGALINLFEAVEGR